MQTGQREDAIQEYRAALQLDPKHGWAHVNLGVAYYHQGRMQDAAAEFRAALQLDSKWAQAHSHLGDALRALGQAEQAIREYREALWLDPKLAWAHFGLGGALLATGQREKAVQEYRTAAELDPKNVDLRFRIGIVLMEAGQPEEAIKEYRETIQLDPEHPEAHCNLGNLLRDRGRFAEALAALKRGHELGSRRPNWKNPSAQWVQRCERLMALEEKLPAILAGQNQPADNAERLELAQLCWATAKRPLAALRLYKEAFSVEPKVADDLRQYRYKAACSAALASSGQGEDSGQPDEKERAGRRGQVLDWLRADLRQLADAVPKDRTRVRQTLRHWKGDPDLAGMRDEKALANLSDTERSAWQRLWAEVDGLLRKVDPVRDPPSEGKKD
jgi:tetratricopeptide (TPR) repeat protein